MAIEIRPAGEAKAYAAAGKQIGEKKEARIQQEQAFRIAAEQRARQWEMEKMIMASQQDFAHEMRLRQAELDKEARAKEWAVEKMEIASRIDFEREEKERQRKLQAMDDYDEALQKEKEKNGWTEDNPAFQKLVERGRMMRLEVETGVTPPDKSRTQNLIYDERKQLEAVVGEEGRLMPLPELRNAAAELGFSTNTTNRTTTQQRPQTNTPQYATNPDTGKNIVSYDGGDTWQDLTTGALLSPQQSPETPFNEFGTAVGTSVGDLNTPVTNYLPESLRNRTDLSSSILSNLYNYISTSPLNKKTTLENLVTKKTTLENLFKSKRK